MHWLRDAMSHVGAASTNCCSRAIVTGKLINKESFLKHFVAYN
jgi:hypothetical protein